MATTTTTTNTTTTVTPPSGGSPPVTSVLKQMTDAGQFSYSSVCALGLKMLFDDKWHLSYKEDVLMKILKFLEQPKQVCVNMKAFMEGEGGTEEVEPFLQVLQSEPGLRGSLLPLVVELVTLLITNGTYDARSRVLAKHLAWLFRIEWDDVIDFEQTLSEQLKTQAYRVSQEQVDEKDKRARNSKLKRFALIGLATVGGGTLIGLTGGLAAPLVAAGAGAIMGGTGAAALATTTGVAVIGSLFGVAGAGLTGYKMNRRVGAVEEFVFEPLVPGLRLQAENMGKQLHITIAVNGWLNASMRDYKEPWQSLSESLEQYSLRWESRYLLELGKAFDYIVSLAIGVATQEALKYTILSGLMTAIAWPASLVSVAAVIDNPWSVCLQRSKEVGKQLAEVLLAREQGCRPVSLVGYSLGAGVIYCCLEELANRKGCEGIVEDVILLGAPVSASSVNWEQLPRVVSGRLINGYCRGDWLLKFLYRSSSMQFRIAGLMPVKLEHHCMHNIDLSDVVKGHLDYMKKLDHVLRVVGMRTENILSCPSSPASSLAALCSSSSSGVSTGSSSGVSRGSGSSGVGSFSGGSISSSGVSSGGVSISGSGSGGGGVSVVGAGLALRKEVVEGETDTSSISPSSSSSSLFDHHHHHHHDDDSRHSSGRVKPEDSLKPALDSELHSTLHSMRLNPRPHFGLDGGSGGDDDGGGGGDGDDDGDDGGGGGDDDGDGGGGDDGVGDGDHDNRAATTTTTTTSNKDSEHSGGGGGGSSGHSGSGGSGGGGGGGGGVMDSSIVDVDHQATTGTTATTTTTTITGVDKANFVPFSDSASDSGHWETPSNVGDSTEPNSPSPTPSDGTRGSEDEGNAAIIAAATTTATTTTTTDTDTTSSSSISGSGGSRLNKRSSFNFEHQYI